MTASPWWPRGNTSDAGGLCGIARDEYDRLVGRTIKAGRGFSTRLPAGSSWALRPSAISAAELHGTLRGVQDPRELPRADHRRGPLGTLNQAFVDRLVEGVSTFLLGGSGWVVMRIQHADRRVRVQPAARGQEPTWGGYIPQFLGFKLCQHIREVLTAKSYACVPARRCSAGTSRRDGGVLGRAGGGTC